MWVIRRNRQFWNQTRHRWTYLRRYATVFASAEIPIGMSCLAGVEVIDLERLAGKDLDKDLRYLKKFREHLQQHD